MEGLLCLGGEIDLLGKREPFKVIKAVEQGLPWWCSG